MPRMLERSENHGEHHADGNGRCNQGIAEEAFGLGYRPPIIGKAHFQLAIVPHQHTRLLGPTRVIAEARNQRAPALPTGIMNALVLFVQ